MRALKTRLRWLWSQKPQRNGHRGRRLAAPERPARGAEAPVEEIGVRRKPGLAAEGADEMGPRHAGDTGEIEKVDILGEARVEIGAGVHHGPALGLRRRAAPASV